LPSQIKRYQEKLSGPILDRIDLHTIVENISISDILKIPNKKMTSENIKELVYRARIIQSYRYKNLPETQRYNGKLSTKQIESYIKIEPLAQKYLIKYIATNYASMRAYHKIIKVAQTIADLENVKLINKCQNTLIDVANEISNQPIRINHIKLATKFRPKNKDEQFEIS